MKTSKFKMTELGPIPEDWEVKRLGDVAETSSGGTPSRARSDYFQGTIKWFTTTELLDCKLYDSIEHISNEALKNSSAKVFPPRTLLMAMYGATIGRLGVLQNHASTNQACCAIFCGDVLFPDYAYYYLYHLRPNIIERGCGAGQPNISQEIVRSLPVVLPPLPEQEKIAEALSDVDALLSAMTTLIEKKRAIKQGAMQQLLTGKTRLQGLGAECAEFKQTELGPIPNDWDVKRIDQCGDVVTGSTPPRGISELWGGNFNWISARDFKGKYIISSEETVTDAGKRYCRALPANSVLVTCIASIGLNAIAKQPCATNQQINAVVCRECDYEYFYYQCCFNESRLRQMVGQTAVPIIGKSQFEAFSIALPKEIKEQQAIAAVLSEMDAEIAALEAKRAKYESIKQGMMQELLTGRTRLKGE